MARFHGYAPVWINTAVVSNHILSKRKQSAANGRSRRPLASGTMI
jgi:hypothetical protein